MSRKILKICGGALLFLSLALPEFILPAGAVPVAQPAVILSGQLEIGQGIIPAAHRRRHWRPRHYHRRHYRPGVYLNFGSPRGYRGYYGSYGGNTWCQDIYGRNKMRIDLDVDRYRCRRRY